MAVQAHVKQRSEHKPLLPPNIDFYTDMTDTSLDTLCVNTIRTLAMDAVQQANSGHPGTPMANGIEYGLMASYAEGLNILRHADVGKRTRATDAETTRLRDPVSRGEAEFQDRLLSAMRFEFGGHLEKKP
jgi:6-phosphogluconate dehydrogenase (decarboxylating)